MMLTAKELIDQFRARFPSQLNPRCFSAPGRVNLIGDHTDYNDGFVLPMAIDRHITIAASPRKDLMVNVYAENFQTWEHFNLEEKISPRPESYWGNYLRAMAWSLKTDGYELKGMDAVLGGDVPIGAGLSSSAAMEIVIGFAFLSLADHPVDLRHLALAAQKAENEFVGMRCGIMDQFISCVGREGRAILIDCKDLSYRPVALPEDAAVVIVDSGVHRGLVDAAYNDRRKECEEGASFFKVEKLRSLDAAVFNAGAHMLNETIRRRTRHVINENQRTLAAVDALEANDLVTMGNLMIASHNSLRDDFQVSCPELDQLVEIARATTGVYGARITGGGFGGCMVALTEKGAQEALTKNITQDYLSATKDQGAIYVCRPSAGVKEIPQT